MSERDFTIGPETPCWVISDGRAGMEMQCLGLAKALGVSPLVKRIALKKPWCWFPAGSVPSPLARLDPSRDHLRAPWPRLVIASGKRSVDAVMALRRAAGGACFTVQIQDPRVDPRHFDLVITPRHDRLEGDNVFSTFGGMNQITPENLAQAAECFAPRYGGVPRPLLALVLGGNSKAYRMTEARMRALGAQLAALLHEKSAGLLITASRRTPPGCLEALFAPLAGLPYDYWNGTGDNPYLAYLALADHILVTCDSVNMVSEAATTGKPVHVIDLDGGSAKLSRFHDALLARKAIRFFDGTLPEWSYEPLADTAEAAAEVRRRFAARQF